MGHSDCQYTARRGRRHSPQSSSLSTALSSSTQLVEPDNQGEGARRQKPGLRPRMLSCARLSRNAAHGLGQTMEITIPKSLEALVRRKVEESHYSTEDEVVADALRLMQARDEVTEIKRARLKAANVAATRSQHGKSDSARDRGFLRRPVSRRLELTEIARADLKSIRPVFHPTWRQDRCVGLRTAC